MNAATLSFGSCKVQEDLFPSYYVSRLESAPAVILSSPTRKVFIYLSINAIEITLPLTMRYCHTPRVYSAGISRILKTGWSSKDFPWGDCFSASDFSLEWIDLHTDTNKPVGGAIIALQPAKYLIITARNNLDERVRELFQNAFRELNLRLTIFLELKKEKVEEAICFDVSGKKIQRFDLKNHCLVPSNQEEIDNALRAPLPLDDSKGS